MHQGLRLTISVRAHRLSEEKAATWLVYRRRSYSRYWEGPLEPQATHWYGTEGTSSLRLWKKLLPCQRPSATGRVDGALCAGNRYCPLLLGEQRVENKISPDCAPFQELKAEKTPNWTKALGFIPRHPTPPSLHVPFCARHDARCPLVPTAFGSSSCFHLLHEFLTQAPWNRTRQLAGRGSGF